MSQDLVRHVSLLLYGQRIYCFCGTNIIVCFSCVHPVDSWMRQLPDHWSRSWQSVCVSTTFSSRNSITCGGNCSTLCSSLLYRSSMSSAAVKSLTMMNCFGSTNDRRVASSISVWIMRRVRIISAVQSAAFRHVNSCCATDYMQTSSLTWPDVYRMWLKIIMLKS